MSDEVVKEENGDEHLKSERNKRQKEVLKAAMDLIKESPDLTMEDLETSLVDLFGKDTFQEVKPFVEGLYRTSVRPSSSRGGGSKRPVANRSKTSTQNTNSGVGGTLPVARHGLATTSSIAHVVNALTDNAATKSTEAAATGALEEVWTKLAVSRSARMKERRLSSFTGYCSDSNLLPSPSLFCILSKEEDVQKLASMTTLYQSLDLMKREYEKGSEKNFGDGDMLKSVVDDSFALRCKLESSIGEFTKRVGGKNGEELWRAPTRGDDNMPKSPFLGSIIDSRYIVKDFIASGSYKTCWKAHDLKTDKPVCLAIPKGAHEAQKFRKELHDGVSSELAVSRGIFKTGLEHIGMVNILDVTEASQAVTVRLRSGVRGRVHYIVMDLCVADLHAYLGFEKGEMPESLAKYFFRQLMECLEYLHGKNRFHLDIKLDNVMVVFTDSTFGLKLIDFTRMTDGTSPTVTNTRVGLNTHCAPEARPKGATYDGAKQDVWSCGRLLLRMVTPVQRMAEIQHFADDRPIEQVLSLLRDAGVRFSKELNDFLRKLMATKPEARMTTTEALQHPWLSGKKETPMSGPAVVAEMERRAPTKRTASQTQAVEWDRETPIDSVVRSIENMVRQMGRMHTVGNQVIVEYRSKKRNSIASSADAETKAPSITVVCEVQHKRRLLGDEEVEEWVSSSDPRDGWKEFDVPDYGRTAWMHNKTKATQWDPPQYSDVLATRVMIRWKLGESAALWLAFVAAVGGGLNRIYCDIAAVKSRMRMTVVQLLIKLRCVLLSGYLIKSNENHNADAISSTIAAFGRLLAIKSKLEKLTLTQESTGETPEDMRIMEHISVVLSAEGAHPRESKTAQRQNWKLEGGKVSSGAFQLLTRDQSSLANSFRSSTGEPMDRADSEIAAAELLDEMAELSRSPANARSRRGSTAERTLRPIQKLYDSLNKLKTSEDLYNKIDRSNLSVRLRPGPYRNRLIWLHQVLVDYAKASSQYDDGKAKAFVVHLPEVETELSNNSLFAPNIEWPNHDPAEATKGADVEQEAKATAVRDDGDDTEARNDSSEADVTVNDEEEEEDTFGLFA